MKIVNREEFLEYPEGTLFSKYEPCIFGDLCIKGDSLTNDFWYQEINSSIKCNDSGEFSDILLSAQETKESIEMDLDIEGRDGLYDENQLFAVWEEKDVKALIDRLMLCTR